MNELAIYTLTGYCVANDLPYMIKDWDTLSAEGQKKPRKRGTEHDPPRRVRTRLRRKQKVAGLG